MNISGLSVPLLVAAALIGLVGLVVLDRLERRPLFVIGGLLIAAGMVPILQGAAASVVSGGISRGEVTGPQIVLGQIGTLLLYVVVGIAVMRPRLPVVGGSLLAGVLCFTVAMQAARIVQTGGLPTVSQLLEILTLLALATAPSLAPPKAALLAKWLLGATLLATVVAGAAGFDWAWRPFEGATPLLPVLNERLQGIFAHPNGLGPAALLYLLLERLAPWRGRWHSASIVMGVGCLALTQSKTAIVSGLAVWALVSYHDRVRSNSETMRVLPLVLAVAVVFGSLVTVALTDSAENELVDPEQIDRVRTFTGRTDVWAQGFEAWQEDLLWGAGEGWYAEFAERTNQAWAAQAHNQFIQTGTEFGLVGLAGLLVYVVALVVWAWRLRDVSRFGSLAVVSIVLLRCITETPLDELDFLHLLVLALLFGWARADAGRSTRGQLTLSPVAADHSSASMP